MAESMKRWRSNQKFASVEERTRAYLARKAELARLRYSPLKRRSKYVRTKT